MVAVNMLRRLLPFLLPLTTLACGSGLSGTYVNLQDAEDRIELDGGSGRAAALVGQGIDVWDARPPRAGSDAAAQLQQVGRAMRQVEMVDVQVTPIDGGKTLKLTAEGRGTRLLRIDPQSDGILTGGTRKYFRR